MKKVLILLFTLFILVGCKETAQQNNSKPAINNKPEERIEMETKEDDKFILDDMTSSTDKKLRIAFVGDSITYGYLTDDPSTQSYPSQLSEMFNGRYTIGNFGKNAAYVLDANSKYNVKTDQKDRSYRNTEEYSKSLEYDADIVVIMLGVNDIRSIYGIEEAKQEFVNSLADLATEYVNLDTVQKVYIATSVPCHVDTLFINEMSNGELQDLQKQAAEECNIDIIDVYSFVKDDLQSLDYYVEDELHLNVKGQQLIAEAIYNYFKIN